MAMQINTNNATKHHVLVEQIILQEHQLERPSMCFCHLPGSVFVDFLYMIYLTNVCLLIPKVLEFFLIFFSLSLSFLGKKHPRVNTSPKACPKTRGTLRPWWCTFLAWPLALTEKRERICFLVLGLLNGFPMRFL